MTRYVASRKFTQAGLLASGGAILSGWCGLTWGWAWIPAGLFLVTAGALVWLSRRPPIEVHETHLAVGRLLIPWPDIRRLDSTGWLSPLVLHLTLFDDRRLMVVYPGDPAAAGRLLRQLRRLASSALIDGLPHRRFWSQPSPAGEERQPRSSPRQRLLRPEDEAEVERLYQKLKAVGHLDQKSSPDDE